MHLSERLGNCYRLVKILDHWPTDFLRILARAAYGFPRGFLLCGWRILYGFLPVSLRTPYGLLLYGSALIHPGFDSYPEKILCYLQMVYDQWPTDFLRFLPRAAYGFLTDFCFLADGFCTDFCRSAYGLLTDYCFMALPWYILALIVTLKKYCVNYKWSMINGLQISYGFYPELLTDSLRIFAFWLTDFVRISAGQLTDGLLLYGSVLIHPGFDSYPEKILC